MKEEEDGGAEGSSPLLLPTSLRSLPIHTYTLCRWPRCSDFDPGNWGSRLESHVKALDATVASKLEGNGPTDERAAMIVVSDAIFDLRFEIGNLNYPGRYMYIAILVASEAMAASKCPLRSHMTSDLNSVISMTYTPMLLWPV